MWNRIKEDLAGLGSLLLVVLAVAFIGFVAGGAIGALSMYTLVGAVLLGLLFVLAAVGVGLLARVAFMFLGFLLGVAVKVLAHPPGYDPITNGEEMAKYMNRWAFGTCGGSLAVGLAVGICLVRHLF